MSHDDILSEVIAEVKDEEKNGKPVREVKWYETP